MHHEGVAEIDQSPVKNDLSTRLVPWRLTLGHTGILGELLKSPIYGEDLQEQARGKAVASRRELVGTAATIVHREGKNGWHVVRGLVVAWTVASAMDAFLPVQSIPMPMDGSLFASARSPHAHICGPF